MAGSLFLNRRGGGTMSISEAIRMWLLQPVLNELKEIKNNMATDQATLDAAIKSLGDLIASEDTGLAALQAEVTALIEKVNAGGVTPLDLTTELTAINSMAADITTQGTNIQASIAAAKPVTGV